MTTTTRSTKHRRRLRVVGAVLALSVIAAACGDDGDDSASGDSEDASGDEHAGHGGDAELVDIDREDRCDIGFNTATFNEDAPAEAPHAHVDDGSGVDFTVEEWAEVFVQPDNAMSAGIPRDVVVDTINNDPMLKNGVLSGGIAHTLEPDSWEPMADHEECSALADELAVTQEIAATYPTAQDAMDAGYGRVVPYYPGIGAHYIKSDLIDDTFELDTPEMLLYDSDGPEANMVGVSHFAITEGEEPPEAGFSGPNDHWHRHTQLCFDESGDVVGGTNSSEEDCAAAGGSVVNLGNAWMNHVWIVPGCESDWGMFSAANPALVERGIDVAEPADPGCGTGTPLDGELDFDEGGHGPSL